MIVVDASVVLKWVSPHEPLHQEALAIRQAHVDRLQPCVCPDLLGYEVANALTTQSHVSVAEALSALLAVLNIGLEMHPMEEADHAFAMRLAREHGLSFYDASYVALARALGCDCVTADLKLHRQLRHLKWVRLLE